MNNLDKLRSILSDKYEIVRLIASGGMGEVYLGVHRVLGKKRAIKIIHQDVKQEQDIRRRFLQEAKLAASIDHPGVIQIMDFGSYAEFDYLIMPYIDGITLQDRLNQGPIPPQEAMPMMVSMAEALSHAHRKNIIHRDIKPSNYMVDAGGRIILTDFGISKNIGDATLTAKNMIMGSPRYMSPEQITGKSLDRRSDLYSLGMIFYQMLTGAYPFETEDIASLAYKQVHELPLHPATVNRSIPAGLGDAVMGLLQKNPADRYPDGEAFLRDLQRPENGGGSLPKRIPAPAASGANAIQNMATRIIRPFKTPAKAASSEPGPFTAANADRSGTGKRWLLAVFTIIAAGLVLAIAAVLFQMEPVNRVTDLIQNLGRSGPVLRAASAREAEILQTIRHFNGNMASSSLKDYLALKVGMAGPGGAGSWQEQVNRYLETVPFIREPEDGNCDILMSVEDGAERKKLVITSNLYEGGADCAEMLDFIADRPPLDKIGRIMRRNYCFQLFYALQSAGGGAGIKLMVPGKTGSAFMMGEEVQFCMEPDFEADCILLDLNTGGIFRLFPLNPEQRIDTHPGEIRCSTDIKVSEPLGNEMVAAIGSGREGILSRYARRSDPDNLIFAWSYENHAADSALELCEDLFSRLISEPVNRWSVAVRFIRILPAD